MRDDAEADRRLIFRVTTGKGAQVLLWLVECQVWLINLCG